MTYVQNALDGFDLPFPEVQQRITAFSQSQTAERGAIFTRREVVDFMLDLAGYCIEEDLTQTSLLEPSFGQGDFLFVAVERLLDSVVLHHGSRTMVPLLRHAIRAVELHQETFTSIRNKLLLLLQERGLESQDALQLADTWLIHDDFLLTAFSQRFTHIVGNPPYVRQELLPDALLARYRALYRTIYDRADLYIPFIERSLSLLTSDGILSFICSDRWMKNRYGGPLRDFISQRFHLRFYVDMTGTDAFQTDVTAYPAITVLTTEKSTSTTIVRRPQLEAQFLRTLAATMRSRPDAVAPHIQVRTNVVVGSQPWILSASAEEQMLLQRLEQEFPLMEEVGCKVGIGVATGCDALFIGHHEQLPIEEERKLPLLMTDDMQTGQIIWKGMVVINPFDSHGALIRLEQYPRLNAYFLAHEEVIKKRHVAKKNPAAWYRTIDKISEPLTYQPKLLIPDIKGKPHVVYDEGHYYPHHNLYFVTSSSWDLQALQALLRSSVAKFFVTHYSVKMRGGYFRYQAQNIRRIPIPRWEQITTLQRERLRQAAMQPEISGCDELAFELYHISEAERRVLLEEGEAGQEE
jgi:TaqI-like C-terminal specificity domain/Eco57I restriction-modification methylase